MRIYLKILCMTIILHIIAFCIFYFTTETSIITMFFDFLCLFFSLILGIVFPLKWCKTKKAKFLTIFLMPTNYTLLFLYFLFIKFCESIFDTLRNLPPNFG